MMDAEENRKRLAAADFAVRAYDKVKGARPYALTPEAKNTLAVLARAMFERRTAEGRDQADAKPTPWEEFSEIIKKLSQAGVNVLQNRPGDAKPVPEVWRNPLSYEPLPPPKTLDEKAILAKHDPELLRWFEEMGKHPYKTVAAHKEAEAQRQSRQAIHYDGKVHQTNVFRGDNLTAKSEFQKRDPDLARFFEEESHPVELPLFGPNRNETVIGKLARDAPTAGLVQVAERIGREWQAADREAALKQRAVAEETLKRLEGVE
jgi:hypothetical protein